MQGEHHINQKFTRMSKHLSHIDIKLIVLITRRLELESVLQKLFNRIQVVFICIAVMRGRRDKRQRKLRRRRKGSDWIFLIRIEKSTIRRAKLAALDRLSLTHFIYLISNIFQHTRNDQNRVNKHHYGVVSNELYVHIMELGFLEQISFACVLCEFVGSSRIQLRVEEFVFDVVVEERLGRVEQVEVFEFNCLEIKIERFLLKRAQQSLQTLFSKLKMIRHRDEYITE